MIAAARRNLSGEDEQDAVFELWQENWDSWLFFLAVSTQWTVVAGMGGIVYVNLNHCAIESNMNMRGIGRNMRAKLCDDLLVIERAALQELNKRDN